MISFLVLPGGMPFGGGLTLFGLIAKGPLPADLLMIVAGAGLSLLGIIMTWTVLTTLAR